MMRAGLRFDKPCVPAVTCSELPWGLRRRGAFPLRTIRIRTPLLENSTQTLGNKVTTSSAVWRIAPFCVTSAFKCRGGILASSPAPTPPTPLLNFVNTLDISRHTDTHTLEEMFLFFWYRPEMAFAQLPTQK